VKQRSEGKRSRFEKLKSTVSRPVVAAAIGQKNQSQPQRHKTLPADFFFLEDEKSQAKYKPTLRMKENEPPAQKTAKRFGEGNWC